MLVALHSGEYVILFWGFLNEAPHWSRWVERRCHREHVQAIRVYVGSETTNAFFA